MAKVSFNYADRKLPLEQKKLIKDFIPMIFSFEKKQLNKLTYVFCSDEYLLEINKKFLNHDTYTDIITFDFSNNKTVIEGEIYISIDRVSENAFNYKTSTEDEFLRVIFHGALHLCGYKDKKEGEKKIMKEKEDFFIKMFHVKHLK